MNTKLILWTIAIIGLCVGIYSWLHVPAIKGAQTQAQIAAANNNIPTAAGQQAKKLPVSPVVEQGEVAKPVPAPAVAVDAPTAPVMNGIVAPPPAAANTKADEKPEKAIDLSPEEMAKIRQELKTEIETKFKDKLSFALDEPKMIAYAQASLKVKKLNNKWDVQIAGADADKTAIEYNNLAVEEITKSLQSMQGLTIDQYNELTKLTATDQDFNRVYQVYKQLMDEGIIKPVVVPATVTTPVGTAPVPQALPTPIKPVVTPVNPGTAQVPQGSPARPYSPPVSR